MGMKLIEKQRLFTVCLYELFSWVHRQAEGTWTLRMAEGYVGDSAPDSGPHRKDGGHYKRIAQDLVLDVEGEMIEDGDHPVWQAIGRKWESLHPYCRWGGRWGDANHFSFEDGGVA